MHSKTITICWLLIMLVSLHGCASNSAGTAATGTAEGQNSEPQNYAELAPFTATEWDEQGTTRVRVNNKWYRAVAIDGVDVDDIMAFAVKNWGVERARKRFTEDLVEVLARMGHTTGETVALALVDPKTREAVNFPAVAMTEPNRSAARAFLRRATTKSKDDVLTAEEALADLDVFEGYLEERFAYLTANDADYKSALNAMRAEVSGPVTVRELNNKVARMIALFIDGHASPRLSVNPGNYLPFVLRMAGDRYVAVRAGGESLVDADFPYVTRIEGRTIDEWQSSLSDYIIDGSSQYNRRRTTSFLARIDGVRRLLGLEVTSQVEIELASPDGQRSKTIALDTVPDRVRSPLPQRVENGVLPGNVGYLRIKSFSHGAKVPELVHEWMPKFRNTRGLIIDVRGNGGGSRIGLVELFPYFLKAGEAHIGNVAKYRLYHMFDDDHLGGSRFSYRASADRWTTAEKETIAAFRAGFQPEIDAPEGKFSDWHYLVLSKDNGDPQYFYDKPVVILADENCFSATDIFVGAFKGWRNVTIMGQPTGGGSARSVGLPLPNSDIDVVLASMMSFQPSGLLYDGRGILPDVYVVPEPGVFLTSGNDNVLSAALRHLGTQDGR